MSPFQCGGLGKRSAQCEQGEQDNANEPSPFSLRCSVSVWNRKHESCVGDCRRPWREPATHNETTSFGTNGDDRMGFVVQGQTWTR